MLEMANRMGFARTRLFGGLLVLCLLAAQLGPLWTPRALAQGPCTTRSDNMTRNGSVTDGGYDTPHGVVANDWNPFLINGDWPEFDLADNESANGDIGGSSSQYIHGDGTRFDSGIYQSIGGTQPGASYDFSVGWAAMLRDTGGGNNIKLDDVIIRRVGVDPTGGTDPQSTNMQWGPEVGTGSSGRSLNHPDMRITFKALADHVTVFLRVYNLSSSASDKVFFDVMCMVPRGDIPVESISPTVTPTLTPAPTQPPAVAAPAEVEPTDIPPTRVPPTATPVPATLSPARVLTVTPAQVALKQSPATPQPRRIIPQVEAAKEGGDAGSGGGNTLSLAVVLGSVGIIALSVLGILLIGGFAVWRIFMRQVDDALDPTYVDDQPPFR